MTTGRFNNFRTKPVDSWLFWGAIAAVITAVWYVLVRGYIINFEFTVAGAKDIFLGGDLTNKAAEVIAKMGELAVYIAVLVNGFQIIGVLADLYWDSFSYYVEEIVVGNTAQMRLILRVTYSFLFAIDIVANLLGMPRSGGLVGGAGWFLMSVLLAIIEYPFLWFVLPFTRWWISLMPGIRGRSFAPGGRGRGVGDLTRALQRHFVDGEAAGEEEPRPRSGERRSERLPAPSKITVEQSVLDQRERSVLCSAPGCTQRTRNLYALTFNGEKRHYFGCREHEAIIVAGPESVWGNIRWTRYGEAL